MDCLEAFWLAGSLAAACAGMTGAAVGIAVTSDVAFAKDVAVTVTAMTVDVTIAGAENADAINKKPLAWRGF